MANSLLELLDITAKDTSRLSSNPRKKLFNFLVRWEGFEEVLACLDEIPIGRLVSLQDLRARALMGLGLLGDAYAQMDTRLAKKSSPTAQILQGHCLLEMEDVAGALKLATELTQVENPIGGAWTFLGDVYLKLGDLDKAETAFMAHQKVAPNSRQPLIGLMQIAQLRGDSVTATAYSVRAYTVNEGENPVAISMLQTLLEFFLESEDANHSRDAGEQLKNRFAKELADTKEILHDDLNGIASVDATSTSAEATSDKSSTDGATQTRARDQITQRNKGHRNPSAAPMPASKAEPITILEDIPVDAVEKADLSKAASDLFGFDELRLGQTEIMACARRGENVLAILPTGAGKSLCYQLLAFMDTGLTLVISPLIALMKDQIDNLPDALRPTAIAINSSLDGRELGQAIEDIERGHYKMVYAAPERLRQAPFLHAIQQGGLTRMVIDEAHCVSIWGHDFRPDYLNVAQAHRDLGAPPILALTATAPPQVRQDIERQLFGKGEENAVKMRVISADTFRPNLMLGAIPVRNEDDKLSLVLSLCRDLAKEGCGIIYARTRQRCEELADMLRRQGLDAAHYHAGVADRAALQDRFMRNEVKIIVATIAFGMGVDKSDIRFILHYGLPNSVESYYQEAGRAGRDGDPASCFLLFSSSDKSLLTRYAKESVVSTDFLRNVYKVVRSRLAETNPNAVSTDELVRQLRSDDTQTRVALSILEEVGLLKRHYDVPRMVTVTNLAANGAKSNGDGWPQFVKETQLPPQQARTYSFLDLAAMAQVAPPELEPRLLAWQSAGYVQYQSTGRNMLLTLAPSTTQVAQKVDRLLDRYATIQIQRVTEIADYAKTRYCRHGHLANYLGGVSRTNCGVCDLCAEGVQFSPDTDLPSDEEQLHLILAALDETSWGRRNLIRVLRGDPETSSKGQSSTVFAKLGFRSEGGLNQLIDKLVHSGYIAEKQLDHGGVALELSQLGRRSVSDPKSLKNV